MRFPFLILFLPLLVRKIKRMRMRNKGEEKGGA
jgi:hypothetical protein